MKNSQVWASYDIYTSELTKHARQIAFGGVAICWIFRDTAGHIPRIALASLGLLVAFFVLDVLHYFVAAWGIRRWAQREEAQRWKDHGTIEGEYELPRTLDQVPFALFNAKIIILLVAYVALGVEVVMHRS